MGVAVLGKKTKEFISGRKPSVDSIESAFFFLLLFGFS